MTDKTPEIEKQEDGPTPEELAKFKPGGLTRLAWLYERKFGELPPEYYEKKDKE